MVRINERILMMADTTSTLILVAYTSVASLVFYRGVVIDSKYLKNGYKKGV